MTDAPVIEPLASPNPATTDWVPLGLGVSGPVGPAGAAGPPGAGVPTPVVNGQWVKGVGGAAVWSPIAQGDLPTNLQANAPNPPGSDLNQIVASGWYNGSSLANAPDGRTDWLFVLHIIHTYGTWATQICWTMQSTPVVEWRRSNLGGAWNAWSCDGWQSFTPTLTATAGNPSIGNGSASSRYSQHGKVVSYFGNIVYGNSGQSAGNGIHLINLPVTAALAVANGANWGTVQAYDTSGGQIRLGAARWYDGTRFSMTGQDRTNWDNFGPGWPLGTAWPANTQLLWNLTYEAA
jgi:hypothetical protein